MRLPCIIPDNGELEKEWFEAIDIVKGSSNLWNTIANCPCCGKKLDLRIIGDYLDSDEIEQDVSELVKKYRLEGDSIEFKVLIEEIGIKLGII